MVDSPALMLEAGGAVRPEILALLQRASEKPLGLWETEEIAAVRELLQAIVGATRNP